MKYFIYKESSKVKPYWLDEKKGYEEVKGGCGCFFSFGCLLKKSFFDLENPKKRKIKNIDFVL